MKISIKALVIGLLIGAMGVTAAFAAGGIKSAEFNANSVSYNGTNLDLSAAPMISVVKDGEEYFSNYMPVRAVLEQLGFTVDWDDATGTVLISDGNSNVSDDALQAVNAFFEIMGIDKGSEEYKEYKRVANELYETIGQDPALFGLLMAQDYSEYLNGNDETIFSECFGK